MLVMCARGHQEADTIAVLTQRSASIGAIVQSLKVWGKRRLSGRESMRRPGAKWARICKREMIDG